MPGALGVPRRGPVRAASHQKVTFILVTVSSPIRLQGLVLGLENPHGEQERRKSPHPHPEELAFWSGQGMKTSKINTLFHNLK